VAEMLETCGVKVMRCQVYGYIIVLYQTMEELLSATIPESIRLRKDLILDPPLCKCCNMR